MLYRNKWWIQSFSGVFGGIHSWPSCMRIASLSGSASDSASSSPSAWVKQMSLVSYFFVTLMDQALIWSHALWNSLCGKWVSDFIKIMGGWVKHFSLLIMSCIFILILSLATFMVLYFFRIPAWPVHTAFLVTWEGIRRQKWNILSGWNSYSLSSICCH